MDNAQKMIETFDRYLERADFDCQASDDLLTRLLELAPVPIVAGYANNIIGLREIGPKGLEKLSPAETEVWNTSLKEVSNLLNSWDTQNIHLIDRKKYKGINRIPQDLLDLVRKYPPVVREECLVVGMVVHALRHCDADLDPNTLSFGEFFRRYGHLILCAHINP